MKVSETCGDLIGTRDGDNQCRKCEEAAEDKAKLAKRRAQRRARDQALRDLGLVKVRGALGGVYWE